MRQFTKPLVTLNIDIIGNLNIQDKHLSKKDLYLNQSAKASLARSTITVKKILKVSKILK